MRTLALVSLAFLPVPFLACGSPSVPAVPAAPSVTASSSAPAIPVTSAAPSASAAVVDAPPEDPNESVQHITMTPLLTKATPKSAYPKATVGDKECWGSVRLSGQHEKDYAAIIAACGTPTGSLEYAKPVAGKLHHKHDKRDTYTLKLLAGMCYRYYAVADQGINDLDILVEKPGGALIADDKQTSPVAIVDIDKSWCMDEDAEYVFALEVDGVGKGGYMFGVWARPKGK